MPDLSPEALSPFLRGSGLVFENMTRTEVTGTIDAGADHHTPWGVVHGGLYATAAESTTSVGASLAVADEGMFAVGLTNQTDFIRAHKRGGCTSRPGRSTKGEPASSGSATSPVRTASSSRRDAFASRTC